MIVKDKRFLSEQEVMEDSFRLGVKIRNSGFSPTFIVGLWRGGSTIGIYVQECLQSLGITTDHIAIRTSYQGSTTYAKMINDPQCKIRVHGPQYLLESLKHYDRLLIVDDVFSTGQHVEAVIGRLETRLKRNMPTDVRVATPYYKAANRRTTRVPDYFLHECNEWLVLPYELDGLTKAELSKHKPAAAQIIKPS